MQKGKVLTLEDRIPKLKEHRRKKANRRLILLLFMFFLLISCVIYIQSPLSHVKAVQVSGNSSYTSGELIEVSGISEKANIWKVKKDAAAERIRKLPEIKGADVKLQFPNTILINVVEFKKIAYLSKGEAFYPVMENGKVLSGNKRASYTENVPVLIGFEDGKVLEEMCASLNALPREIYNSISEVHYTPEKIDKYHVSLFMNDGFEVSASLRTFAEKMVHYPSIVSQLDPKVKGVIDLEVGSYFKAYKKEEEKAVETESKR